MTSKSLNPSPCWIVFIKQNYILLKLIQSLIYKLTMTALFTYTIKNKMTHEKQHTKVLCMGELLWDMIPTGKMVGGAPFNVAYHLNKLGVSARVLTRIGNDMDGVELVDFLTQHKIDSSLVQVDKEQPTSKVEV